MEHRFAVEIKWTGNSGSGTSGYNEYVRDHVVSVKGKPEMMCSSDPVFLGDGKKYNPEDLFIASLSACHMLWYLHLCADAGIIVTAYSDEAEGKMIQLPDGGGHFTSVNLYPFVTVKEKSMTMKAMSLHDVAAEKCFIANSCNFPVTHHPSCRTLND